LQSKFSKTAAPVRAECGSETETEATFGIPHSPNV